MDIFVKCGNLDADEDMNNIFSFLFVPENPSTSRQVRHIGGNNLELTDTSQNPAPELSSAEISTTDVVTGQLPQADVNAGDLLRDSNAGK